MRYLLTMLTLVVANSLCADTIGKVDFQLPTEGHGWKLEKNEKTEQGEILFYIPDNVTDGQPAEFFAATTTPQQGPSPDQASLTTLLEKQFPGQKVQVTVIESSPESVTFEWVVGETPEKSISGWTRIFTSAEGTTTLGYINQQPEKKTDELRAIWSKILKEAKTQL